jgi:hypothetical protein
MARTALTVADNALTSTEGCSGAAPLPCVKLAATVSSLCGPLHASGVVPGLG